MFPIVWLDFSKILLPTAIREVFAKERDLGSHYAKARDDRFLPQSKQILAEISQVRPILLARLFENLPAPPKRYGVFVLRFAKFLPKRKTWGRTRKRPAMTDFHRKLNKFIFLQMMR